MAQMYRRHAEQRIREAMEDTRVTLVTGPRQSGKTTLVKTLAHAGMEYRTLDNATTLEAARFDPAGFVRGLDRAIIDEVQRAPGLLLAIKESVDEDPRPGRFLLTGSANLMTLPKVADSLAGRMEVVQMLPLAQSELLSTPGGFLADAFANRPRTGSTLLLGGDLVDAVLAGGYPEALGRKSWPRRQRWYMDYMEAILQRDVRDVAQVEQMAQMPRLLAILAEHSGQLVNYSGIGGAIGMNHVTTQKYTGILESLYLVRGLQPWFNNRLKRLTKSPKLHFLDSGLLAALRDVNPERVKAERGLFGPLLETFVSAELLKIAGAMPEGHAFTHFRDRRQHEVDVVIEDRRGRLVGIEVKSSATVSAADFAGLRMLAEAAGDRFAAGYVLYDHHAVVPFAEKLHAVPISALWS